MKDSVCFAYFQSTFLANEAECKNMEYMCLVWFNFVDKTSHYVCNM